MTGRTEPCPECTAPPIEGKPYFVDVATQTCIKCGGAGIVVLTKAQEKDRITRISVELGRQAEARLLSEGYDGGLAQQIGLAVGNIVSGRLLGGRPRAVKRSALPDLPPPKTGGGP